ncbi:uncharacterized protein J3R85_020442, partial [Psidium guajava]
VKLWSTLIAQGMPNASSPCDVLCPTITGSSTSIVLE